ncbi:MAG: DUF2812 domain-containing protein [Clostridia bacterium]
MKHIVRKAYWDYEKEEKWLNEMSAKGLALTDYAWCRYTFTDTPNNEYIYRIEFLENLPTHPESMAYIKFLEENGVEFVASYLRWVYFRKKSVEGAFDIYSDLESKIRHFKRIGAFWKVFMYFELIVGLINIVIGLASISTGEAHIMNLVAGIITVILGLVFLKLDVQMSKKIKKLQQEKAIRE